MFWNAGRVRTFRLSGLFGLVALLGLLVAACGDETKPTDPAATLPSSPDAESWTSTAVIRNPVLNNGETLRVFSRDDQDRVRRIDINFKDNRHGVIEKDEGGHITVVRMTLTDRSVMAGVPSADGKSIQAGSLTSAAGKPITKFAGAKTEAFQADGHSLRFVETRNAVDSSTSWKFYRAGGIALVGEVEEDRSAIQSIKLYDADGHLKYAEVPGSVSSTGSWQTFSGTVFDAQGKPTHRITGRDAIPSYLNGSSVLTIEELAADGVSTTSTIEIKSRWSEPPHQIGVFADQDALLTARRQLLQTLGNARDERRLIESALTSLLDG